MPVLLFAAESELDLVRPLAARLRKDGAEVRCYLESDDYELRSIGCKIAVGDLDDAGNLEAALTGVHTFIPILPELMGLSAEDGLSKIVKLAECAAESAAQSSVEQTILPLIDLPSMNGPVNEVLERVEESFVSKVHPLLVLKTPMLWGPDRPLARAVSKSGAGELPTFPIKIIDVQLWADAVAAADDREDVNETRVLDARETSLDELRTELRDNA